MIVCDASAVNEMLVSTPLGLLVEDDLEARGEPIAVPHLLDVEVVSALRRLVVGGRLDPVGRHAH